MASTASISRPRFRCFDPTNSYTATPDHPRYFSASPPTSSPSSTPRVNSRSSGSMAISDNSEPKIATGPGGYVLEDVPHLVDYIPDLPTYPNPLQDNPSYSVVKQYFVNADDTVAQKIVVHKDSPRGTHFRRSGPRQKVYFEANDVGIISRVL